MLRMADEELKGVASLAPSDCSLLRLSCRQLASMSCDLKVRLLPTGSY